MITDYLTPGYDTYINQQKNPSLYPILDWAQAAKRFIAPLNELYKFQVMLHSKTVDIILHNLKIVKCT